MSESIMQIIEEEAVQLEKGEQVQILFEDGVATVFQEIDDSGHPKIITLLEELPHRLPGSIFQYLK